MEKYNRPEVLNEGSLQSLSLEDLEEIQQKTLEIKMLVKRSAEDVIQIGKNLKIIKSKLNHGDFRKWIKEQFSWSVSSATKFMQVYEKFKSVNFTHLNFAPSAMYILASPSTYPEALETAIELSNQGQFISFGLAKQLKYQHHQIENEKPNYLEINENQVNDHHKSPEIETCFDVLSISTEFIQKIDNHISDLISLEEEHKIIEIVSLKNLVFLINQQINIAKRNDYNISLIFIFSKNACLNIEQDPLFNQEFKSRLRTLSLSLWVDCLWRDCDFLVNAKDQDFDIAILPYTNQDGVMNVINRVLEKIELHQYLDINLLDLLSFGIYQFPNSCLTLDTVNISTLLSRFQTEIDNSSHFLLI